jgi:SAM-dependent methyltransferase
VNTQLSRSSTTPKKLQLDPHAQFIYELALARLELRRFGVEFDINPTLNVFRATRLPDPKQLFERSAYITAMDQVPTQYALLRKYNKTRSVNQYLTHWFYPYKGKFHPQMVRALLNIMQLNPGSTVLDPFIGSGTTAVEAQLLGLRCIGVDISPVCTLVSRVKTESTRILDRVVEYKRQYEVIARTAAKSKAQPPSSHLEESDDERVRNFFKVAELIAHSDQNRRSRPFIESFVSNITGMSTSVQDVRDACQQLNITLGPVDIRAGDARNLPLENASVDAILTSPPYAMTLDYIENDRHAFQALGYNPLMIRDNFIGVRGNKKNQIDLFMEDIKQAYEEMYRVLRPGCWCVIIVGNRSFGPEVLDLPALTIDLCSNAGFEFVRVVEKPLGGRRMDRGTESILMFIK